MVIFNLKKIEDNWLEEIYDNCMKELEKFYETKLENEPNLIILKNRKELESLRGKNIPEWTVGFSRPKLNSIFLMELNYLSKTRKYSMESYIHLIKHELSHLFYYNLTKKDESEAIAWFAEGVAIYTDGRLKYAKERPKKFSKFIELERSGSSELYKEPGFVIELLIKKFGKEKLLNLIRENRDMNSKKDFKKAFKKIYGFELSYTNINKLYKP